MTVQVSGEKMGAALRRFNDLVKLQGAGASDMHVTMVEYLGIGADAMALLLEYTRRAEEATEDGRPEDSNLFLAGVVAGMMIAIEAE